MAINIKTFFDSDTATFTHIVSDPSTQKCAIIDSVLDYDQYSGRTKSNSADQVISYINEENLSVEWILETHIHADHITASHYLKEKLGVDFLGTTSDGAFTLQEGECMGACGDSPVLLVNNKRMCSHMSNEKIDALVEELKK